MRWAKLKDQDGNVKPDVIVSDTMPAYKIAKFNVCGVHKYRPSQAGEFIGKPVLSAQEAKEMCERHKQIMG